MATDALKNGAHVRDVQAALGASVLIRAGESVKVVQERLGHTSAAMTLDVYSYLWPADDDRTRGAVDAALEALAAISRTSESAQTLSPGLSSPRATSSNTDAAQLFSPDTVQPASVVA